MQVENENNPVSRKKFVLWGAGQLIAMGWSLLSGRPEIAWPVMMTLCGILTGVGSSRTRKAEGAETLVSRALGSIWFSCGITIFFLGFTGNPTGAFTFKSFLAVVFALLGVANMASGLILRWRTQQVLGVIWWAASITTIFVSSVAAMWVFVAMTIGGELLFGIYLMLKEKADLRYARAA